MTAYKQSFQAKKYTGNIISGANDLTRGEKFSIGALSVASIGIGIATIAISKKCQKSPLEILKNQAKTLLEIFQKKHPKKDPLKKLLKNRRDAQAVKDYQVYMAKQKIKSLEHKFLNNEITIKDKKAYEHIVKNKLALERFSGDIRPAF